MYHSSPNTSFLERMLMAYLSGCDWIAKRLNQDV